MWVDVVGVAECVVEVEIGVEVEAGAAADEVSSSSQSSSSLESSSSSLSQSSSSLPELRTWVAVAEAEEAVEEARLAGLHSAARFFASVSVAYSRVMIN